MTELLNLNESGVAIQGYDPVAYFTAQPTQGNSNITSTYGGAIYFFINAENKALFDADPEKYVPQYGGFCAIAVSENKTFGIDPQTYKITEGKLYLFYNGELGNTKPLWEADETNRHANADTYWQQGNLTKM